MPSQDTNNLSISKIAVPKNLLEEFDKDETLEPNMTLFADSRYQIQSLTQEPLAEIDQ